MDRNQVRSFVERDWDAFARIDREAARDPKTAADPLGAYRIACALLEHMRCVRPDWPTESERAADFEHHVEQKRTLDRASRALAAR
jgi:hypothetical protein